MKNQDCSVSDIRPQWLSLVRRLQSKACQCEDQCAILSVTIVIDQDGNPICWSSPKRTIVEPKYGVRELLLRLGTETQ